MSVCIYMWQCISFFCIVHFCHTCSLCRVELVVQFPARGSSQVLCLFPGVLWLWHYIVSVHILCQASIYTLALCRGHSWRVRLAGDADSSRPPSLTSGLQGSVNVHRGAPLFVSQWQCISSFYLHYMANCPFHTHVGILAYVIGRSQIFSFILQTIFWLASLANN